MRGSRTISRQGATGTPSSRAASSASVPSVNRPHLAPSYPALEVP